jgi:hypothetical protein
VSLRILNRGVALAGVTFDFGDGVNGAVANNLDLGEYGRALIKTEDVSHLVVQELLAAVSDIFSEPDRRGSRARSCPARVR